MATLRAATAFHADGQFIADGQEVASSDPIVKGREALFVEVEADKPKAPAKKVAAKKARPADA